ncbi:MAG TPA: hypothetical protein VJ898_12745 [Natrialbaceae archaeon]|nr:hypothetical protein [Natrialbaceae archaeon]
MSKRSVWRFEDATEDGKDVLVYDPGGRGSDLQVFTQDRTVSAEEATSTAEEGLGYAKERPYLAESFAQAAFEVDDGERWEICD